MYNRGIYDGIFAARNGDSSAHVKRICVQLVAIRKHESTLFGDAKIREISLFSQARSCDNTLRSHCIISTVRPVIEVII